MEPKKNHPAFVQGLSTSGTSIKSPPLPTGGLETYSGEWGFRQAAHLLRRAMFGPNEEQIKWSAEAGMTKTVEKLFEALPLPESPVNPYYDGDPLVPVGASWVDAPYSTDANLVQLMSYRGASLFGWTIDLILQEGISAREKLTLFWHNHFPMNDILDPNFLYRYITLLRTHAWGNFRELTKAITIDPAMLGYLNGDANTAGNPNENYARELLELFTIGKGPQVAPGDYTNFTEQDVKEIARILTGWKTFGFLNRSDEKFDAYFDSQHHDKGVKTLSHRFQGQQIFNLEDQEYAHLIDIIFQKEEVARFICRQLYRWFVFYHLDEQIETAVIEPMARILIDNDFEIKPAVQALLSSNHFYDSLYTGAIIKNPIEFIMSIYKPLRIEISTVLDQRYDSTYRLYNEFLGKMQMVYYFIPEVAGWRAYYVHPVYYRSWINSTTLPVRIKMATELVQSGLLPFRANGPPMIVDVLKIVDAFENPLDPNEVIKEFSALLLPLPLQGDQREALKQVLLGGLPDFEWTAEYGSYAQDPGNARLAEAIEAKLRSLLQAMLSMAEFQLT